ncbi:hypothetical protein AA0116_g11670 [Alternaria tenuissima]|nr:hypothetical protein AA0116_g11670 [Alternaria tenuissima]
MDTSDSEPLLGDRRRIKDATNNDSDFSVRAVLAGMLIGVLINISNTYYGLISGSSQQMPIVSALLGYLGFRFLSRFGVEKLSRAENVLIASTATATGCMPVTAGFAELIPALEYILEPVDMGPVHLSWQSSVVWSLGVAFFGIIFASLLRRSLVMPKDMPWPGATASSNVIKSLHTPTVDRTIAEDQTEQEHAGFTPHRLRAIFNSAGVSSIITVFTYFLPVLHDLPIFGSHVANTWLWTATLSPGFFGGGMIMGPEITLHMLLGAIVGWAILSPYAKTRGYAPGPTDDWETGSRGWIIWISLSALIADAVVKIGWICLEAVHNNGARYLTAYTHYFRSHAVWHRGLAREDTLAADHEISNDSNTDAPMSIMKRTAPIAAFVLSILLCVATTTIVFSSVVPWYHVLLSVLLALPMAVVSIRTLGESDYNPQSGLLSQLFFASIVPHSSANGVLINIISASISTAGASQTGDLAYDFKIGQLVGAMPTAQLFGQVIGFQIPGSFLQVPSAFLLVSTAKLVLGRGLPSGVSIFMLGFGMFFVAATILRTLYPNRWWRVFIPSGVSFAVGIFLLPAYTIARTAGGLFTWVWIRRTPSNASSVEVIGSGLILGEAIASLFNLGFTAFGLPQFGPQSPL